MEIDEFVDAGQRLKKLIEKKFNPVVRESQLRYVELNILLFISDGKKGDTAKEIMRVKNLSKGHISQSLENLRKRNYIRFVEDDEDRRIMHIRLNNKAVEIVEKLRKINEECRKTALKGMSDEEVAQIMSLFCRLNDNVQANI